MGFAQAVGELPAIPVLLVTDGESPGQGCEMTIQGEAATRRLVGNRVTLTAVSVSDYNVPTTDWTTTNPAAIQFF